MVMYFPLSPLPIHAKWHHSTVGLMYLLDNVVIWRSVAVMGEGAHETDTPGSVNFL